MKALPILMSAPMVRALLAGQKTQTRRVIKCHPLIDGVFTDDFICMPENHIADDCPYGKPGDLLWVRETFCIGNYAVGDAGPNYTGSQPYAADFVGEPAMKWKPSIHMPRAYSRLTLRITDVRVQRLQDISEADARAEGCNGRDDARDDGAPWCKCCSGTGWVPCAPNGEETECGCVLGGRKEFRCLWESINGPDSWDANPYVWALTFQPILRNVDDVMRQGEGACL